MLNRFTIIMWAPQISAKCSKNLTHCHVSLLLTIGILTISLCPWSLSPTPAITARPPLRFYGGRFVKVGGRPMLEGLSCSMRKANRGRGRTIVTEHRRQFFHFPYNGSFSSSSSSSSRISLRRLTNAHGEVVQWTSMVELCD